MTWGGRLRWALIVVVVGIEATVGWLALNPRVADQFRGYFIDRSTDCWPLPVSGEFKLGQTISMVANGTPSVYNIKLCGWMDPEDTGTWSMGSEARLRFHVPYPIADLWVSMELLPFTAGELVEQDVDFAVDGVPLEMVRLGPVSSGIKIFRVPRDLVLANWGRVDIEMHFPNARSPQSLAINNDRRKLAIRVLSVRVSLAQADSED